ncbi:MocR-like pyridoxine biosynthesis transcription factor PdxR [Actinacidiphila acididurans]|uniref:PLP-dependent aminotransferase family protein n=1 Tax=Actinacidiphila acididurans TaxID=2784346 RepID=A0ABS2TMV4_9ACTN|nr:PLP-dependent aminotransferase family protein [Actinacidiphila acididurans]MBM9504678.1 PLP-dependent aminotransferase family protein [Actinacidiphila acididurans]
MHTRATTEPPPAAGAGDRDLLLDLARERTRAGLERALREAVRGGRLAPGIRLPSSRVLARDLGLARNTVADAYAQLVAEGWLTARQGSGTRVAPLPADRPATRSYTPTPAPEPEPTPTPTPTEPREALDLADLPLGPAGALPYHLSPGSPDVSAFPRTAWAAAARRAITAAPSSAFGYGDPRGRPELRGALAGYLGRVRGVLADPETLVICTGYVQAVGLLARALHERGGRRVALEALGFPTTRGVLSAAGLDPVDLPVDGAGADVTALDDRTAAVVLTPAHQFPLGVPLSPERRTWVTAWARKHDAVVVEDDYDGEFRYDRQPVGALQGLAPDHVVYAGTASKSLAPGLRLAWLAVPPHLLDDVLRQKRLADHLSPVLDQLTLADFIASGAYDRHVRRMRLRYRARRDHLVAALARHAPGVRVSGIAAGLHAVLELPPTAAPLPDLVTRARRKGLALSALPLFGAPPTTPPALVVGYGSPPDHAFPTAVRLLCEVLNQP